MRSIIIALCFIFSIASISAQKTVQNKGLHLTFEKENIQLGEVKKGDKRTFQYTFTNTGTETVDISIVSGCDCTTLDWTRGEIKPGEKGIIDVIFDSTEKEASETVDVDMYLKNINPKSNSQYLFVLDYTFELTH
jgi:peptidoglycan-associated lipoprotein